MDTLWVVYDALAHHQLPALEEGSQTQFAVSRLTVLLELPYIFRKGRHAHQQKLELEIAEGCAEGRHQAL